MSHVALRICSYVGMWLYGFVAMWLCGYVAVWLCGCVVVWLCGYSELCSSRMVGGRLLMSRTYMMLFGDKSVVERPLLCLF